MPPRSPRRKLASFALLAASVVLTASACVHHERVARPGPLGPILEGSWQGTLQTLGIETTDTRIALDLHRQGDEVVGAVVLDGSAEARQVRFTRAAGGDRFTATVGPYTDQRCDCQVSTVLFAAMRDGAIDGTFETRTSDSRTVGLWGAERVTTRVSLRP